MSIRAGSVRAGRGAAFPATRWIIHQIKHWDPRDNQCCINTHNEIIYIVAQIDLESFCMWCNARSEKERQTEFCPILTPEKVAEGPPRAQFLGLAA